MEVLIHVGVETVNLKGEHFSPKVAKGQRVSAGDLLVEFDLAAVIAAGYNPMTIMVVTNSADLTAVALVAGGQVSRRASCGAVPPPPTSSRAPTTRVARACPSRT